MVNLLQYYLGESQTLLFGELYIFIGQGKG